MTAVPAGMAEPVEPVDPVGPVEPPRLRVRAGTLELVAGDDAVTAIPGARVGPWTVMAVLDDAGGASVVVERLVAGAGELLVVDAQGVRRRFPTSLARTDAAVADRRDPADALPGGRDVLRAELLAGPDDPDPEAVARAVPPLRRLRDGDGERPHTFVGSPDCADVVPVYYDPLRATTRVNVAVVAPQVREAIEAQTVREGLVGGWLPVVRLVYPVADGSWWEQLLFAVPHAPSPLSQPVWYRFAHVGADGRLLSVRYVDTYLPYPVGADPSPDRFYRALQECADSWEARLAGGMRVEVPETWIPDFCRHSFALEMITRFGDHPRYGVVDRVYGAPEHDGFQDVLTSAMAAYLEWGRPDVARRYADEYLTLRTRDDGRIDYRGPEIGQYARTLTLFAQYARTCGDVGLLDAHAPKLRAVAEMLLARRARALALPPGDPTHGLVAGRHEADISFDTPSLATFDYERPYLSNSAETARALRDLGALWRDLGDERADDELAAVGRRMVAEGDALRADLLRAVERSWLERGGTARILPLVAGSPLAHLDAPYRSRPEAFDENRVWAELLHSGMLPAPVVREIVEGAAERGDSSFGLFGNRKQVVAFTAHGIGYGLIQHDLIREFLLLYHAHAAHLHTRGTWTAVECADLDRDRAEHWPYCAPAQLTIPLLTKWMLVFDDPDRPVTTWLCRATPRAWLRHGGRIAVADAPTVSGPLDVVVTSRLDDGVVEAHVDASRWHGDRLVLRLRVPLGRRLDSVTVDERPWSAFDAAAEAVTLPPGRELRIVARYAAEDGASSVAGVEAPGEPAR